MRIISLITNPIITKKAHELNGALPASPPILFLFTPSKYIRHFMHIKKKYALICINLSHSHKTVFDFIYSTNELTTPSVLMAFDSLQEYLELIANKI